MAFMFAVLMFGLINFSAVMPAAVRLEDLEVADDTMSVGSYIREVRAAAPEDYHRSYENEGDGEIGYSRKKSGGGKKGYQHFDSYHKKAGDHYEFEKQDSFGLENEKQDGAHSHTHEQREKYKKPKSVRHRKRDSEYKESEGDEPSHEGYEEVPAEKKREDHKDEPHYEELKEGAHDGNGGVEAHGHDPKDYVLPEKYTYGSDEAYNY